MYQASKYAKEFSKKVVKFGKENSLVLPHFQPILEKISNFFCRLLLVISVPTYFFYGIQNFILVLILTSFIFGLRELFFQDSHALVRIYGPLGRLRYIFESEFRDKYLQYFNETNTDGRPIPRIVRDYVYQKAHNVKSIASFGTELDIFDSENSAFTRILHRNFPGESVLYKPSYEVTIGAKRKNVKPFKVINTINVSAMSYGSLNYKAAEILSFGTKDVGYLNTGEGGYGPHGISGNDIVFQIGTGKFGVGDSATLQDGSPSRKLNEQLLKDLVRNNSNIKMIQIKISQGAKPGLGGVLPGDKVTPEIAAVRKVEPWKTVISPPTHFETIASSPKETILKLFDFIEKIRNITELPVGIKLCVGRLDELDILVEAMSSSPNGPDAIQIDGADGGTGAGPNLFLNYVGYGGAVETLAYLHRKLISAKIRDKVVLSASGRILTPVHASLAFAYGAEIIDTARGAMFAMGCIQALKCHTNHCPTGITTNSPWRIHGLDLPEKSTRVHNYLKGFQTDMFELTKVMGHKDPRDIRPEDLRVISYQDNFANFYKEDPLGIKVSGSNYEV